MARLVALVVVGIVSALTTLSCGDANTQKLEATIEAQATQLARLEARSAGPTSTPTLSPTPAPTFTPEPTATAIPSPTPVPVTYDRSLTGQTRYIANTGGSGVRLRLSCVDDSPGTGGWPEGAAV